MYQEQNITQQEINERERRRIIEGCGLASSDEDEENEVTQPQSSLPVDVDLWRTEFSSCQTDYDYSNTAVGHSPVFTITDEIDLEPLTSAWKGLQPKGKGRIRWLRGQP